MSIAREYIYRKIHKKNWQHPKLVFYEDGIATTVSVDQWGKTYSLKNNGKVDASNDGDMATQIIVGLLPLLLYQGETPPKVALVGYGSGVTAGAITQYPIKSLEVVELEPRHLPGVALLRQRQPPARCENPKVTARVGDGRNFLRPAERPFDVIVSQPSNPWLTGVSNLFTREYFRDVKTRLAPHGIFCQWAQLYEMSPWNIKTIYRHRARGVPLRLRVRRRGSVVGHHPDRQPRAAARWTWRRSSAPSAIPSTRAEARAGRLASPHDVFAYLLLGARGAASRSRPARPTTPTTTRASSSARRAICWATRSSTPTWPRSTARCGPTAGSARWWPATTGPTARAKCGLLARSLLAHGKSREAELWTRRAEAAGDAARRPQHARLLLDLVSTRLDRDPEIPLAPGRSDDAGAAGRAGQAGGRAAGAASRASPPSTPRSLAAVGRAPLRDRLQDPG